MGNCCNATTENANATLSPMDMKPIDPTKSGSMATEPSVESGSVQQRIKIDVLNSQYFSPRDEIKAMVEKYGMPLVSTANYHGSKNPVEEMKGADFQYVGQVNEKKEFDGFGQILTNNSLHVGYFKNGKKSGLCRTYLSQNRYIETNWENDEIHGKCFYQDNDLAHHSTIEYVKGQKEGSGEEHWEDGTVFKGKYHSDLREGYGEMTWADGNSFKGEFRKGCIEGKGKYVWSDGKMYEGDWKQDKMHGEGVFSWPDGRRYVGSYIEDQKEGKGTFYWSEKKKYEGQWQKGKQHGLGKYYDGTGACKEGIWNQGQYVSSSK